MTKKNLLKKIVSNIFYYSGLTFLSNKLIKRSGIIFLMYHKVKGNNFQEQMSYLIKNYEIISADKAIRRIKNNDIKGKEIVLTFDDGYKDTYNFVYPVLKRFKTPATVFLTTSFVDGKKIAWWELLEVINDNSNEKNDRYINKLTDLFKNYDNSEREKLIKKILSKVKEKISLSNLKNNFITWNEAKKMMDFINFGAHTKNHPNLRICNMKRAKDEILNSKKIIEKKLKTKIKGFCYPNGDYNSMILKIVKESGFDYACTAKTGVTISNDNVFEVKRIGVNHNDGIKEFKLKLSPLWLLIK